MLFSLDLGVEFFGGAVFGELFGQLALNRGVDELAFKRGEIIGILRLQFVDGIKNTERLLNLFDYTFLFDDGWERNRCFFYFV